MAEAAMTSVLSSSAESDAGERLENVQVNAIAIEEEDDDQSRRRLSALQLPMLSLSSLPSEATDDGLMLDTTTGGEELDAQEAHQTEEREGDDDEAKEAGENSSEGDQAVTDSEEKCDDDSSERDEELSDEKATAHETRCPTDPAPQQQQEEKKEEGEEETIETTPRSEDLTVECASPRDDTTLDNDHEIVTAQANDSAADAVLSTTTPVTEIDATTPLPERSVVRPATYTVKSLFPVVFDAEPTTHTVEPEHQSQATHTASTSAPVLAPAPVLRSSRTTQKAHQPDSVASRLAQLQQTNDRLKTELQAVTRAHKLQLQLVERERVALAQRTTRLASQLATLTAELTRCKAENAKLATENELYAAKLPQLSAALSQETTQLDERNAQSVASQLELSSLRARAQVLQTRNQRLEADLQALQQTTRRLKSDARRKAIVIQQADEKLRKLESELHEARSHAADERHQWKRRLQELTQRMDRERRQRELEHERDTERRLNDVKVTLHKAQRERKDADAMLATLRQELEHCKQQLEQRVADERRRNRELRAAEATIRQYEKREATLRSHLHRAKLQLRGLERESKQRDVRAGACSFGRMVLPKRDVEGEDENEDDDSGSDTREREDDEREKHEEHEDDEFNSVNTRDCKRCAALLQSLEDAETTLVRLREQHATELKLQATAYERALQTMTSRATRRERLSECA